MTWIFAIPALALVLFVLWMALTAFQIQRPSCGEKIDPNLRPNAALLVIDMQPVFLNGNGYGADLVSLHIDAVLRRIKAEKSKSTVIIALQQEWNGAGPQLLMRITAGGRGLPGKRDTQTLSSISELADHIVIKHVQDGFERPELSKLLNGLGVGEVEIIGLDGLYCVKATALGAASRGYGVRVNPSLVITSDAEKWAVVQNSLAGAKINILKGE